jgi:hypothetical protein
MKQHSIAPIGLLTLLVVVMSLSGCGQLPNIVATATSYPTYTPVPTYTLVPTYTPLPTAIPARWDVKVVSVSTPSDFDGYHAKEETSRYIVITVEYTYQRPDTFEFSPESVVLMNVTKSAPSRYYGWSNTTLRYQPEDVASTIGFGEKAYTVTITPGKTRTEKFGWVFPKVLTDFLLFFPETEALEITIE